MTQKSGKAAPGQPRPAVDWEKIEGDYRAGVKTLRASAAENGISEALIRKRAKREGWERDLTEKIRKATRAAISAPSRSKRPESEVIAEAASIQIELIRSHQRQVQRLSGVRDKLVEHLEAIAEDGLLLGTATQVLEKLTGITEKLVKLERQAFNVDDEKDFGDGGAKVCRIERVIIDVANTDSAGFSAAAAAG